MKLFSKTKYPSLEQALVGYWLIKLNFSMMEPDPPSPARVGGNRSSLGTGAVKGNLRVYLAKEQHWGCHGEKNLVAVCALQSGTGLPWP